MDIAKLILAIVFIFFSMALIMIASVTSKFRQAKANKIIRVSVENATQYWNFRSVALLYLDKILLDKSCKDLYNYKIIKSFKIVTNNLVCGSAGNSKLLWISVINPDGNFITVQFYVEANTSNV